MHLGPPKTATTSLQYALQQMDEHWFQFGGVFQPRESGRKDVADILRDISTGELPTSSAASRVALSEIKACLERGTQMFVSEEMLLMGEQNAEFCEKLRRVSDLLKDIPTTPVVCLRDPEEGIKSLYQQIFKSLPITLQLSFERFCDDHRSKCFDYEYLLNAIDAAGFPSPQIIDFDEIAGGRVQFSSIFGSAARARGSFAVGLKNGGQKSGGARQLPGINLKSVGRSPFVRRILDHSGMRNWKGYRVIVSLVEKVRISAPKSRTLHIPDAKLRSLRTGQDRAVKMLAEQRRSS